MLSLIFDYSLFYSVLGKSIFLYRVLKMERIIQFRDRSCVYVFINQFYAILYVSWQMYMLPLSRNKIY